MFSTTIPAGLWPGFSPTYRSSTASGNDQIDGRIILVMQRLHEDDLAGYLLDQGGWFNLELPAIADEEQIIQTGPTPDEIVHRKIGDLLHPERISADDLQRLKREMGSLAFSAQYQQRPIPHEGNIVKRDWFKSYSALPAKDDAVQIIQSWDVALYSEPERRRLVTNTNPLR